MNLPTPKASQPLSIILGSKDSRPYKSIDQIEWQNIPSFAVLSGVNGSGKTQFLQALAYKFTKVTNQQFPHLNSMPLTVVGDEIGPHEIAYLPNGENTFRLQSMSISNLMQAKHNLSRVNWSTIV